MKHHQSILRYTAFIILGFCLINCLPCLNLPAYADDLPEIKQRGVLRHLGISYANFVTDNGEGLDIEMIRLFAKSLGVQYQFVKTNWQNIIGDLTGNKIKVMGNTVEILGAVPIRGDIASTGLTIIPWREKVVEFGIPNFPTQVWLIALAGSTVQPIKPSNNLDKDIAMVKSATRGRSLLGMAATCFDPQLYGLDKAGAVIRLLEGDFKEMAHSLIKGKAELTILDVPDVLMALDAYPGRIKVIGPVSEKQMMAAAFAKGAPQLKAAYNNFFKKCQADGTYLCLLKKYYPSLPYYFPEFFISYK